MQDELAEIAALDGRGKARFFLFRVGGVLLGVLGLVLIVRDSVVLGTLLLIAGLTLCITASPQSVNRNCPDQKQLARYPAGQTLSRAHQDHRRRCDDLGAERAG